MGRRHLCLHACVGKGHSLWWSSCLAGRRWCERLHFSSLPGLGELLSVVVLAYMGLILGEGSFVCMNGTPEHCIYFTPFSSLARALSTSLMEAAAAAEPLTLSSRSFLWMFPPDAFWSSQLASGAKQQLGRSALLMNSIYHFVQQANPHFCQPLWLRTEHYLSPALLCGVQTKSDNRGI